MDCNKEKKNKKGLYVPELESDACGTGLIANLNEIKSNSLVTDALTMLENMHHRGACGCQRNTGDGAGILTHIPHELFERESKKLDIALPAEGEYGVGMYFLPKEREEKEFCLNSIVEACQELKFKILGFRNVPVNRDGIGSTALSTEPSIVQVFVQYSEDGLNRKDLERRLYLLRGFIEHKVRISKYDLSEIFYACSFSSRTIVYKGQLTSYQVRSYFPDLSDKDYTSAIALVHSRFSTNTVPKWYLAQPFRCISHNGEINTVQGNINWWNAREPYINSDKFSREELDKLFPLCDYSKSDSSNFDRVLEFLLQNGRSIPNALMMMIPEAYQNDEHAEQYKKDFYKYHEAIMEPWDGPASITFTDGTLVGATLDRNGLRPSRYMLTDDNVLILASETGTIDIDPAKIVLKDRLEPGKILVADLDEHRIIKDHELKEIICQKNPYGKWLEESTLELDNVPSIQNGEQKHDYSLTQEQLAFGYTSEDEELILAQMSSLGKEPIGSMGIDTPLAVLSRYAQHVAHYFKQQFAQVTNPPIDPLREKEFMSLQCYLGICSDILSLDRNQVQFIRLESPVLSQTDFMKFKYIDQNGFRSAVLDATYSKSLGHGGLQKSIEKISKEAEESVKQGNNIIIISNRNISDQKIPIPSLLFTGAVHHHLIKTGQRKHVSIVVDGGDIIETHHFATLVSYGADAIYPSLANETVEKLAAKEGENPVAKVKKYKKAVEYGLMKVMSKLGISTILSYKGAQTFEALGIADEVVDVCFKGTVSRIQGMTFEMLAKEAEVKHDLAFQDDEYNTYLQDLGIYQWKRRGEYHLFNPSSIHLLQHSTKTNDYQIFKKYTEEINKQDKNAATLRSLFTFTEGQSIPLEEVEPAENIMKRFATGAMSFGSISYEAHSTLAIAMNRIGAKSNSGEGGEDQERYKVKENGDSEKSAIKQVASGRFGVTINYLTNSNEIQIKMAQGAKPGEGGQLPGHKVDDWIARVRHSTPGVGLISPPPHHDIYSIEDLAQLIYDLKNANREARISVKLVSKAGVGIIATGVVKGHADHILISGHDGGTGASPLSSIRHAGLPWELGLAETHQVLLQNQLRSRVRVQSDGQMRTGKDMAIATLLGAEEWGIATAALVVEGCILMRKCHLNTCPVGVATQDPVLREKYTGDPDHIVNFFRFLAEDMREIMAELGFRTIDEMVGQVERLKVREDLQHWKLKSLDLSTILYKDPMADHQTNYKSEEQDHEIDRVLDRELIEYSRKAIENVISIQSVFPIKNTDRAVGAMLSNEIAKVYGDKGLPDDSISFRFRGSAGQSFGAFAARGLTFTLEGDTNDYFGKGLSGAKLIVTPDRNSIIDPSKNIIIGNVALYGATSGEAYIKGRAGERFCVRNSGALAVVEGVGAHGCEYMTGGRVVILGDVGRNFAAGMSGGIAYIYDPKQLYNKYLNTEMVELETLEKEDFQELRTLIRNHFTYTGSAKALKVLQDWNETKKKFVKIIPTEYKAVIEREKLKAANQSVTA